MKIYIEKKIFAGYEICKIVDNTYHTTDTTANFFKTHGVHNIFRFEMPTSRNDYPSMHPSDINVAEVLFQYGAKWGEIIYLDFTISD